jgi:hypothetical protein
MVGFYETVMEELIKEGLPGNAVPKYVASTATIRAADAQVQCLFDKKVTLFPPKGISWDDRGIIRERHDEKTHSTGEESGRLYAGLCPVGTSGLAFQRDLYTTLLHSAKQTEGDRYWTKVGYYNAVRELSGARALMSQDVKGALQRKTHSDQDSRVLDQAGLLELSGRCESTDLPTILNQLETIRRGEPGAIDVLLTTSMFGTGVDVDRLNMMVVAGQPKTTAQYIQATGRVGRQNGAIVATYLRGSRPRDLDHYERFLSYHLQIHRNVEPVTVRPFALTVIQKAGGPLLVSWLRNSRKATTHEWMTTDSPGAWVLGAPKPREFDDFTEILKHRNSTQTLERRIDPAPPNAIDNIMESGQDRWAFISKQAAEPDSPDIKWDLRTGWGPPPERSHVILGGERHLEDRENHKAAYGPDHPAPNSLRSVDSTVAVKTRGGW